MPKVGPAEYSDSPETKQPLKALEANVAKNNYVYSDIDPDLLEFFEAPPSSENMGIDIDIPEFTTLCPITGQPDFATFKIKYYPRDKCIESKSLKLYLLSYRNAGSFHESCTHRIAKDIGDLISPQFLKVYGKFNARGGIGFEVECEYFTNEK